MPLSQLFEVLFDPPVVSKRQGAMPLSRLFEVLFDNPVVAKYPIF